MALNGIWTVAMSGLSVNIDLKTGLILNIHHKDSIQSFLKQGMEETASRLRPSGESDTHTERGLLVKVVDYPVKVADYWVVYYRVKVTDYWVVY